MGLIERDSDEDEVVNELMLGLVDAETMVVELGDETGEPVYRLEGVSPGL
jgi:hypothetical protein